MATGGPSKKAGKKKPVEDWAKCRDWLADKRITPTSTKIPSLQQCADSYDLYIYLKDGTELCRFISLVTETTNQVNQQIIYRTNGIVSIEEKNINLFLRTVKDKMKIPNLFGRENPEKILRTFESFHKVLDKLSVLSLQIEKDYRIKGWKRKESGQIVLGDYKDFEDRQLKSVYDASGQNEEITEHSENVYQGYVQSQAPPMGGLDAAVNELIEKDKSYTMRVIANLQHNFINKNENYLLKDIFWPHLPIQKLLDLHNALQDDYKTLQIKYSEIFNILQKHASSFLTYAKIAGQVAHLRQFLADQQAFNVDVNAHVKSLEKMAKKEVKDDNTTYVLQDLILMPTQHLMRFPMMLENILKFAEKEKKLDVVTSARQAKKLMENICQHTDKYSKDCNYLDTIDNLYETIKDLPDNNDLKNTRLEYEIEVDMRLYMEERYDTFSMLCFDQCLVFCNVEECVETINQGPLRPTKTIKKAPVKRFQKLYMFKEFDQVRCKENRRQKYTTITFLNEKDQTQDDIVLKLTDCDLARDLAEKFRALLKASKRTKVPVGGRHKGHDTQRYSYVLKDDLDSKPQICYSCNRYLLGKIQEGVSCVTCGHLYHEECIRNDYVQHWEDAPIAHAVPTCVPEIEREKDFLNEKIGNKKDAEKKLACKRDCSFVVFKEQKKSKSSKGPQVTYIVSEKVNKERQKRSEDYLHHNIFEEEINGEKWFWIKSGEAQHSVLELIRNTQLTHFFFYPYFSKDAEPSDTDESSDEIQQVPSPQREPSEDERPGCIPPPTKKVSDASSIGNEIDIDDFDHGIMTKEEAEDILRSEPIHSFLIRFNKDGYRISKVIPMSHAGSVRAVRHFVVHKDSRALFSITPHKSFIKLSDLVAEYQNVDPRNKYFLGEPLLTKKAESRKSSISSIGSSFSGVQKTNSRIHEPYSLPYFHGTMTSKEAFEVLNCQEPTTFLLRRNMQEKYIISFKQKSGIGVSHVEIYSEEGEYYITHEEAFPSIRRLIEDFIQTDKLIKIPLMSTIRWRKSTYVSTVQLQRNTQGSANDSAKSTQRNTQAKHQINEKDILKDLLHNREGIALLKTISSSASNSSHSLPSRPNSDLNNPFNTQVKRRNPCIPIDTLRRNKRKGGFWNSEVDRTPWFPASSVEGNPEKAFHRQRTEPTLQFRLPGTEQVPLSGDEVDGQKNSSQDGCSTSGSSSGSEDYPDYPKESSADTSLRSSTNSQQRRSSRDQPIRSDNIVIYSKGSSSDESFGRLESSADTSLRSSANSQQRRSSRDKPMRSEDIVIYSKGSSGSSSDESFGRLETPRMSADRSLRSSASSQQRRSSRDQPSHAEDMAIYSNADYSSDESVGRVETPSLNISANSQQRRSSRDQPTHAEDITIYSECDSSTDESVGRVESNFEILDNSTDDKDVKQRISSNSTKRTSHRSLAPITIPSPRLPESDKEEGEEDNCATQGAGIDATQGAGSRSRDCATQGAGIDAIRGQEISTLRFNEKGTPRFQRRDSRALKIRKNPSRVFSSGSSNCSLSTPNASPRSPNGFRSPNGLRSPSSGPQLPPSGPRSASSSPRSVSSTPRSPSSCPRFPSSSPQTPLMEIIGEEENENSQNVVIQGFNIGILFNTIHEGNLAKVKRLRESGMDMSQSDWESRTALHVAASDGHIDIVLFLLEECQVKRDPMDRWGKTPCDAAKHFNHPAVVQLLSAEKYNAGKSSFYVHLVPK